MISDDINDKIEDDLEDDFEVDDDFDDGFEEDWDGEDGDDDEPLNAIDAVDNPKAAPSGDKTFLQKFFIPIVVLVIALFGGLFFLGQNLLGGGSSSDPSQPVEQVNIPAPTPDKNVANVDPEPINPDNITPIADVLPELPEANGDEMASIDEPALRPMPEETDTDQSFELVDLDAELLDSNDDSVANDALSLIDNNADTAIEDITSTDPVLVDNSADAVQPIDEVPALVPNEVLDSAPEEQELTETVAAVISSSDETSTPEMTAEPTPAADPVATNMVNKEELDKLANENIQLESEIKAQETTIEDLRNEIDALKKDLEMAKNAQAEAVKIAAKSATPAPAPEDKAISTPKEIKSMPEQNSAKTTAATPAPRKVVRRPATWVLKSAQPGKATIADTGSGDLKTIEIGQKVSGLGQILSIQIENGLWVVRGSKKTVSQ